MLTVIEKVLLLQDFDLFIYAYTEHLAQLAGLAKVTEVEKDSILFRSGDTARNFLLVLEGSVALEQEGRPQRVVERDGLDCWSFFSESPHLYTARALSRSRLLSISLDDMVDLLTSEADFCWAVMRRLAVRGRDECT